MKTIQITIEPILLERVDRVCQTIGVARSAFIRQALELSLKELSIADLEQRHIRGYQNFPVAEGEFDQWEEEQAWGEQ